MEMEEPFDVESSSSSDIDNTGMFKEPSIPSSRMSMMYSSPVKKLLKSRVNVPGDLHLEPRHKSLGILSAMAQSSRGDVTELITREDDTKLVNVEYPGVVENPANALRTLGGPIKVSEVLQHPTKRLELRFRPADPFCNPIHGAGRTTVGILVKVRRRKQKSYGSTKLPPSVAPHPDQGKPRNLIDLGQEPKDLAEVLAGLRNEADATVEFRIPEGDDSSSKVQVLTLDDFDGNGKPSKGTPKSRKGNNDPSKSVPGKGKIPEAQTPFIKNLVNEELELNRVTRLENESDNISFVESDGKGDILGNLKTVVKLPKGHFDPPKSNIRLETLGIVTKTYDFTGLADYQYLPTIRSEDGTHVSIADNIFPGFGDPEKGFIFDYEDLEGGSDKKFFPFSLPSHLSRIERPMNMPKSCYAEDADLARDVAEDTATTRTRRSVYTQMIHFNDAQEDSEGLEEAIIPTEPYAQALEDAAKKFYDPKHLTAVRKLFQDRPIWTKSAVQWETKYSHESLKYLLPCVAYFSLNGPWRSLWIRFGYDPRSDKTAFIYQLIDFRFPVEHRGHQDIDQDDRETYHKFKPNKIPPKAQMFYQLSEIKIPEIQELQGALTVRLNSAEDVVCDPKYGYLDEDIMEFCRYCMSRCIEIRLCSLGKIPSVKLPQIKLEPGGSIPVNQLKIKSRKPAKKRLRQSTGRGRARKAAVPEVAEVSYDNPNETDNNSAGQQNLTDYFDDDEELEEEDVELYDGGDYDGDGISGNLDDCFEDDEDSDEEAEQNPPAT